MIKIDVLGNVTIVGEKPKGKLTVPKKQGLFIAKHIPSKAFQNCSELKEIVLPCTIKTIGREAFIGCTELESINLPEGLKTIGENAFSDVRKLKQVLIPKTVESIERDAFGTGYPETFLESIDVDPKNKNYMSQEGVLFSRDGTKLIQYPANKGNKEYTIPDGVTEICRGAFSYSKRLQSVVFPLSLRTIGGSAFWGCILIETLILPKNLETIGPSAFHWCISLRQIEIPYGVNEIPSSFVEGCIHLKSVSLPNTVRCIESSAFSNCKELKDLQLPDSLQSIGWKAFEYCYNLKKLELPASIQFLNDTFWHASDKLCVVFPKTKNSFKEITHNSVRFSYKEPICINREGKKHFIKRNGDVEILCSDGSLYVYTGNQ